MSLSLSEEDVRIMSSAPKLDPKTPSGSLEEGWKKTKFENKLVAPNNRRKHTVLVVGTGLAGASASASLSEQGYHVKVFTYHDSPRRAHSIAAQGGINSAKNYQNDGDSVYRLFYDTIKGGDFRSREANVYRLSEISTHIIDHCVAQGIPFAREYGGLLDNRSFGGAQVSRTFYARGQTGQQLLLGAYSSLMRQYGQKKIELFSRTEMLDLVVHNGKARGIIARNLVTGELSTHLGDAVVLATGGYGNAFYLSTNAKKSNVTASFRAYKRGALFANPCFTQIHPTCIPVSGEYQSKLTLMSESLRNDGRVWVPKQKKDPRSPHLIPESERDYYLERIYPSYGNLGPRDITSRAAKRMCDEGYGVGSTGQSVYLDFADAIKRLGKDVIESKYGNLFDMYKKITEENPYETPMRIYPAVHYTMGGLWVDYHLMSNIPGLFVLGEANFSDHGANRLGASALMQGLSDGYFIIPYTLGNYIASNKFEKESEVHESSRPILQEVEKDISDLFSIGGNTPCDIFHKQLGHVLWNYCGMSRTEESLTKALEDIKKIKTSFYNDLFIPRTNTTESANSFLEHMNSELERAFRIRDFIDLGELLCLDALERKESCGAHFREEYQTSDGEAQRDDTNFCHVAVWDYQKNGLPKRYQEELEFKNVHLTQRNYK